MNANKKVMPESFYSLDDEMSLDKITRAKNSGDFLVAKAVKWSEASQSVMADLGNDFKGEIPLNEFSIYPVTRPDGSVSPTVYSLLGKNICVCVQAICDNKIVLSRKANMLNGFNFIKQCETQIVTCSITAIANYGLFVDVGFGINGLIKLVDLTTSRVHTPSDLGFTSKQFIDARVISIDSDKNQISLSHKDLFENDAYSLTPGDIVEVITLDPLNAEENGYFVYLSPNTPALMDPPFGLKIPYGSRVSAVVKSFSKKHPDKVRLRFLSFID